MAAEATQRLFFALWPDDAVRAELARLAARVRLRAGRWVRPENLHVTLIFLGAVGSRQRACVEAAGESAAHAEAVEPFALTLDRFGWWRRPQVLWAGSSATPDPLLALVQSLQSSCEGCGFPRENRAFQVHATLARKVTTEPPPLELDPIPWTVDRFVLVESALTPTGSEYRVLKTWPLSGPAVDQGGAPL